MNSKQEIIDAGLYLVKKKLIARTWGNISKRINSESFEITPSGKEYSKITYKDIPIVKIEDCSYDKKGPKPSSEKLVHAVVYKLRDDVKCVVHTHQLYASAICAEGKDVILPNGTKLPCAKYGLPSTKTLANNVYKCIEENPDLDMFLMEKHGTIVFGKTMEEALKKAELLEKQCKQLFLDRCPEIYIPEKMSAYLDDYAQIYPPIKGEDSVAIKLVQEKNAAAYLYIRNAKPISKFDQKLQHFIYKLKYSKLKDK